MRFMIFRMADKDTEAGVMPKEELFAAMGSYMEEMHKAGIVRGGEGLQPTSKGARLKFSKGKPAVIDGPFTESKELIAGFWLIQVKDKDEAIAWMKRAPFGGGVQLEIRQVFEMDDFGPVLTPELREQEARLRAQASRKR